MPLYDGTAAATLIKSEGGATKKTKPPPPPNAALTMLYSPKGIYKRGGFPLSLFLISVGWFLYRIIKAVIAQQSGGNEKKGERRGIILTKGLGRGEQRGGMSRKGGRHVSTQRETKRAVLKKMESFSSPSFFILISSLFFLDGHTTRVQ